MNVLPYKSMTVPGMLAFLMTIPAVAETPDIPPLPDPRTPVDYLAWLAETYAPPSQQDAGPFYANMDRFFPDYGDTDTLLEPYLAGPWREATPILRSRALKYEWAFREFIQATDRERCFIPLYRFGDFADFKIAIDYAVIRYGAKLLIAQAWGLFGTGMEDMIVDASRRCLRAADHLAQQPVVSARYQAAGLTELTAGTLLRAVHFSKKRDQLVATHLDEVLRLRMPALTPATAFLGEQAGAYDTCQRCFAWDQTAERYVVDPVGLATFITLSGEVSPQPGDAAQSRRDDMDFTSSRRLITDYYSLQRRLLAKPYVDFMQRFQELDRYIQAHGAHPFTELLLFDGEMVADFRRRVERARAHLHGARLVWALHRASRLNGAFPKTLNELPVNARPSVRFAADQGLAWVYGSSSEQFTLAIGGIAAPPQNDADAKSDTTVIWPLSD